MAKLSAAEEELLEKLSKKREAPDAPPVSKSISASIDLGNADQVKLAIEHGFLTAAEVRELKEGGDNDDDDDKKKSTATPRRKGSYFKDGDDE